MFVTAHNKAIGLVLDISLRHLEGQRIVDVVKRQMTEWMRKNFEESEDCFYLYHPQSVEPTRRRGESIAQVANYVTEGWLQNLRTALIQTFWVLVAQDPDAQKHLLFITDRVQDEAPFRKLFLLEQREKTEMQFVLLGIGQYYQRHVLDGFTDLPQVKVAHLKSPSEIVAALSSNI